MVDHARWVFSALNQVDGVLLGKSEQVRLAFACLLAGGHLLIEDVPGVGKTTLAHALAVTLGLRFSRVQFTSDLLPADVIGSVVYQPELGRFEFHKGPVFAELLLADEVNRSTPRTQSALLEAMEEGQVTVDGVSHALPRPFFVVATQNPVSQVGTFPLPESQLDRFLMGLSLGYPEERFERALLLGNDRREQLSSLGAVASLVEVQEAQGLVRQVGVSEEALDVVQRLTALSRSRGDLRAGLSPRAALGLLQAARAWAWLSGRSQVQVMDVRAVFVATTSHRLLSVVSGRPQEGVALDLLSEVGL